MFIDETWTKTNMAPLRGWCARGERLKAKAPFGRWKTMTFVAALRCDRIEAPCLFDGPINGESFLAYVQTFLVPTLRPGDVVVMDNLGSHRVKQVRRAIRQAGAKLLRQRADTVRLVYRHFPIANVHPYAESAAEATEAAAVRGRFWDLHDWLYEHQDQLDPVHLSLGVEQLGLPPDEVGAEVGRHAHADRVRQDFVGGIRSGVDGTPTLFVNEVRHDGGYDLADLLAAVDAAADA